jgi:hypothetical protein
LEDVERWRLILLRGACDWRRESKNKTLKLKIDDKKKQQLTDRANAGEEDLKRYQSV